MPAQASLLDEKRKPLRVYCEDGDAISVGELKVRPGGNIMFVADVAAQVQPPVVRPGVGRRGRILDEDREPISVFCVDGERISRGVLAVRPGGAVVFEEVINVPLDEEASAKEDRRQARRQARAEGTDPREAAPVG